MRSAEAAEGGRVMKTYNAAHPHGDFRTLISCLQQIHKPERDPSQ